MNNVKIASELQRIAEELVPITPFASKLFEARQVIHVIHLQTRSYAAHKALNEFYDGILDLTDQFIETYQGEYGIIRNYTPIVVQPDTEPVDYLEDFVVFLKNPPFPATDTHLQNIVDEMMSLTQQTLYKLKNLH